MLKLAGLLLLLSSRVFADPGTIDCPPIGQTAKRDMVYAMDCQALKPENKVEVLSSMPPTNMKDTVIPKSGKVQTPETTPTTGENKWRADFTSLHA